jgi:hypothetical protein
MKKFLIPLLFIVSIQSYAVENEYVENSGYKPIDDPEDSDKGYIIKSPDNEKLTTQNKNIPEILCAYAPSQTETFRKVIEKENITNVGLTIAKETGVALISSGLDFNKTADNLENKAEKQIRRSSKEKFSNYCESFISQKLPSIDDKDKESLCAKTIVTSTALSKSLLNKSGMQTTVNAPFMIDAAIILAGTAVTVELICAPINHPELTEKVIEASKEFASQTQTHITNTSDKVTAVGNNVKPIVSNISIKIKESKDRLF